MCARRVPLQLPAALAAAVVYLSTGMAIGWSSPVLPRLERGEWGVRVTADEASWLASTGMLCVGPLALLWGGLVADAVGRRALLLAAAAPFLASALWQMFAASFWELLICVVLGSVGVSVVLPILPMYTVEIAEDRVRGLLVSLGLLAAAAGSLLVTALVSQASLLAANAAMVACALLFVAAFWWMPESPYYLMARGRGDEAARALMLLRGKASEKDVQGELDVIRRSLERHSQKQLSAMDAFRELRRSPATRKSFALALSAAVLIVLCGVDPLTANATQILLQSGSSLDADASALVLCGVQVLFTAAFSLLVDRLGRRPLLLASFCGCSLAQLAVGAYFYLQAHGGGDVARSVDWLPLAALLFFYMSFDMGGNTLLWVLPNELVPAQVRGLCNGSVSILMSVLSFGDTKLFQVVSDSLGRYWPFWFFSVCAFCGFIFTWFLIPETKGRSLMEASSDDNNVGRGRHEKSIADT